jgi:hypothetical protein
VPKEHRVTASLYFLIAANSTLLDRLSDHDSDVADVLRQDALWSWRYSDRSDWTVESHTLAVKLLLLAHSREEFSACDEYGNTIGGMPISLETFDRWYCIKSQFLDEDCEIVSKRLSAPTIKEIPTTGVHAVDQFFASFRVK